jgi:hypothetical protein
MKIILSFLMLTACSTMTPRTCEQRAWESAGNAMANTQYALNEKLDWDMKVNCSSANGCANTPILSSINSGQANGPQSDTHYRGLSSREAFDNALKTCQNTP